MRRSYLGTLLCGVRRLVADDDARSDRELLTQFAEEGDDRCFTPLIQRHGAMVLGTCQRALGNEQDAEDVFQAVFLVLARKAGRVGWSDSVGPWLHEVARRLASEVRTREAARRRREQLASRAHVDSPRPEMPLLAALDEELARMPEEQRVALILCHLEGRPREQVAQTLGLSLRTLERRLTEGRQQLRLRLEARDSCLGVVFPEIPLLQPGPGLTQRVQAIVAGSAEGAEPVRLLVDGYVTGGVGMFKWKLAMALTLVVVLVGFGAWSGVRDRESLPTSASAAPVPKPKEHPWFAPIDPRWRVEEYLLKPEGDPSLSCIVVPLDKRDPNYHDYRTEKRYFEPGQDKTYRRILWFSPTGRKQGEIDRIGDEQRDRSWHANGRFAGWCQWRAGKWLNGESFSPDGKNHHRLRDGDGELVSYSDKAGSRVHRWYSKESNFLEKCYRADQLLSVRFNGLKDNYIIVTAEEEDLKEEKGAWMKRAGTPAIWVHVGDNFAWRWRPLPPPHSYETARESTIKELDTVLRGAGMSWEKLGIAFIRDGKPWPTERR